ncbi:MAG: FGGY family carbohydrate kinase, partial [Fibrobacterota bacterium]
SLFSQAGHRKDIAKNTYGTGIFLLSGTGEKPVFSSSFLTSVAWQRGSETSYAVEGQAFMAGAALQWLRDNLKIIPDTPSTEKIAGALSDNEGVYFVPAFQGLASPYWDSSAKGMITGLTRKTSDSTIIRACLESLAYQTKDIIESMEKEFGSRHRKLKVDGGACANDFLMQFQADILGIEVERPVNIQTTALGAAGMAGCACGFWQDSEDFVKLNKTEKVFYPRMSAEDAAVLFNGYKKAVAACRSLS